MKLSLKSLSAAAMLATVALLPTAIQAQEPPPAGGSIHDEIKALRDMIELQSKQIQLLSDQVARLTVSVENRSAAVPAHTASGAGATEFVVPSARPVQPPPPPANVHIIVKGDSLDKVARSYNTTIADLLKLNKITDPKKLQIGQQIILPPNLTPAAAPAVPATPGTTSEAQ